MPELVVENIHLRYGVVDILKGASFNVERGKVAALLGPSGSGKTTLLRAVAGLERAYEGNISISGKNVFNSSRKLDLPAEERGLGFVFQSYALWPNRSVFDNVSYGLRLRKIAPDQITRRVNDTLEVLGLGHLGARYPHQLSGGQQQRVAIARALVYEPAVLLLDEPLSNLDAKLRDEARAFLKELIAREGQAAVIVTHDQVEALAIADTVVLLNGGIIEQEGSPHDLYNHPKTLFSADFVGNNISIAGHLAESDGAWATLQVNGFQLVGRKKTNVQTGEKVTAICRLDRLSIVSEQQQDCFRMERSTSMFLGERWEHVYRHGGMDVRVLTRDPVTEESSWVKLPREEIWIF